MGSYTEGLFKRNRLRSSSNPKGYKKSPFESKQSNPTSKNVERLVACAIIRDGVTHSYGFRSHAEIRRRLGDSDPYKSQRSDREGFITSTDRFVSRQEAKMIGVESGQCSDMSRELLSSDVNRW